MDAAHNATNQRNNPLWMYSLKQYSCSNCSEFLLDAQQHYKLDINVLLFMGWLATQKRSLNMLPLIKAKIPEWQSHRILPIRNLRIRVKELNHDDFYQHMKNLELEAEYQEQIKLYELHEHMDEQDWRFNQFIRKGCELYFNEIKQEIDERWLQTLIEYLQPND